MPDAASLVGTRPARTPRAGRVLLSGGFNSGTGGLNTGAAGGGNATNSCFVVNSLQDLRFCNITPPWLTSVKMLGNAAGMRIRPTYDRPERP